MSRPTTAPQRFRHCSTHRSVQLADVPQDCAIAPHSDPEMAEQLLVARNLQKSYPQGEDHDARAAGH